MTFSINFMSFIFGLRFIIPAVLTDVVTYDDPKDESGKWAAIGWILLRGV
jgi:hypothetical protein